MPTIRALAYDVAQAQTIGALPPFIVRTAGCAPDERAERPAARCTMTAAMPFWPLRGAGRAAAAPPSRPAPPCMPGSRAG